MPTISFSPECKAANGDRWGCPRSGKCRNLVGSLMDRAALGKDGVSSLYLYQKEYAREQEFVEEVRCNHIWVTPDENKGVEAEADEM